MLNNYVVPHFIIINKTVNSTSLLLICIANLLDPIKATIFYCSIFNILNTTLPIIYIYNQKKNKVFMDKIRNISHLIIIGQDGILKLDTF